MAGCSSNGSVALAPARPTATPAPTATHTTASTAQPQVVHVGFNHAATTSATYGAIANYAPSTGSAAIIQVLHGSQVVFTNDGTGAPHTASGLGTAGFPSSFDTTNGSPQAVR